MTATVTAIPQKPTIEVRDLGGIHVLMLGDMILTQATARQLDRSILPLPDGINEHDDPGVVPHAS
jgi:hypothetical protein